MDFDFSGIDFDFALEDDKKGETPKQEIKSVEWIFSLERYSQEEAQKRLLPYSGSSGNATVAMLHFEIMPK